MSSTNPLPAYKSFISTICNNMKVYALKNNEGYATSFSEEHDDEDGDALEVFCFWSSREKANACVHDEWKDFEVDEIELADFLEKWCVGMSNEGLLIGSDFSPMLEGPETDPLMVILDVIEELNMMDNMVELQKFKDTDDLAAQVRAIMSA